MRLQVVTTQQCCRTEQLAQPEQPPPPPEQPEAPVPSAPPELQLEPPEQHAPHE